MTALRYNRFTSCYDEDSTQEEIFENDVQPMIDVAFGGVVSALILTRFSGDVVSSESAGDTPGSIYSRTITLQYRLS